MLCHLFEAVLLFFSYRQISQNINQGTVSSPLRRFCNTKTLDKQIFKCSACGKNYLHKRNLWRHLTQECGKEPMFQCPFCPHKSKRKFNIEMHINYKHFQS